MKNKSGTSEEPSLKLATARTLKWNTIDRVSSQVVFALVGIVLANVLSKADFGLVAALSIFQAFAIIFVDSGFGAALLQKKEPTDRDYSTVFWFNLGVCVIIYAILYVSAPLIAEIFHDQRLESLSKVMFLIFVVNGLAIVQTNRLMKKMQVKMIAVSNVCGLIVSGILGIWMALSGYGAWSLVGQQLSLAIVKTGILWATGRWIPTMVFSLESLKEIWGVGVSVFSSTFLNTVCLNIYNFVIAWGYGIVPLGIYTQAEKWSKMGSASVSQILTASFVPVLSRVQDDMERFHGYIHRINQFTSFILFPFMIGLTAAGGPLFHTLFGTKWDEAIPLFQILMIRGIFVVLHSLYSNYLLALGKSRSLFAAEVVKDVSIAVALLATIFFGSMTLLVWGQLAASILAWLIVLRITCKSCEVTMKGMLQDLLPYFLYTCVAAIVCVMVQQITGEAILQLILALTTGMGIYLLIARMSGRPELPEAAGYLLGRFRKKKN